jgi:hypothetical protein
MPVVPKCENMQRIADDMQALHSVRCSKSRSTSEYLMFCLIGFGSIERRDSLLNILAWALEPLLQYSAFVKDVVTQEFEAIVITKKQVEMGAVEDWLALFNMGVVCIEFEHYMQADMVTCVSRIHHTGKHWHGSLRTKVAARVRRDFYKEYCKQQQAKETQRVLDVTGLTVTPRNMLTLHSRVGSLQDYVLHLENQRMSMSRLLVESTRARGELSTQLGRDMLAEAYSRLQAAGQLPVVAPISEDAMDTENVPPPPPHSPSYRPETPPYRPSSPSFRVTAFLARPPPTGDVTLYVVR